MREIKVGEEEFAGRFPVENNASSGPFSRPFFFFFLPAALDLIHSGWLHYSYYSASVRSFRSSVA